MEDSKKKQVNDIISVVKLSSLMFAGIEFLKNFFKFSDRSIQNNSQIALCLIIGIVLMLLLIYSVWAFSTSKKFNSKYSRMIQFIDSLVFVTIFSGSMLIFKYSTNSYKFLFIFIIITTTIQLGMKEGIIIAAISSFIILTIDLVYVSNLQFVNECFEEDLIAVGSYMLTVWTLGFYVKTEKEHIKKLESLANRDGLTGIYNHRFFYDELKKKVALSEKEKKPVSMVFIDIDYFKHYNDLYGHQKGDEVLKYISAILKDSIRKEDIVARYGGEEFAIILNDAAEKDSILIAEAIRKKIEGTYFEGEENQPNGKITVSIGIATYPTKAKNHIELVKCADDALYRAKFFDKNRVETYTSILDELKKDIEDEHIDLVTSIKTLISVINAKDRYTYGHVERVVAYCKLLANQLRLSEGDKKNLIYSAYMHDIGKINISEEILNKRGKLEANEWEILKEHPSKGVEIINPVESLKDISSLILHHHERYDGKGYPDGLKGRDIPYLARVLTVADSFDAMTSNRPYNVRKNYDEAVEELKRCSGTQFDPSIVEAFLQVIKERDDKFPNIA